jgi:hypothetical protein
VNFASILVLQGGINMRERTLKISDKQYQILSEMLKGTRQRAQVVEGLIEVLGRDFKKDKYILYDVITNPLSLMLKRTKE